MGISTHKTGNLKHYTQWKVFFCAQNKKVPAGGDMCRSQSRLGPWNEETAGGFAVGVRDRLRHTAVRRARLRIHAAEMEADPHSRNSKVTLVCFLRTRFQSYAVHTKEV